MPKSSKFQNLLVIILCTVGLLPMFFFVSIEMGIAEASVDSSQMSKMEFDPYIENVAFGVSEKFTFDINYGFINAGTANMEVVRLIDYNKRPCYQIVTTANSNSFFSTFYKVEDRVESIVDALGIFSWRFEKRLKEGGYRSDRMYEFDQRNNKVFYNEDTLVVPPQVQDAISVLYYIRTQDLKVGETIRVDNFTDGKLYPLEINILKKETITVKAGTFDCIVVEPLQKGVGIFKHEGKLKVWLTDDRLKMPVQMKSKVIVGSITAELTDFQLGEIESF